MIKHLSINTILGTTASYQLAFSKPERDRFPGSPPNGFDRSSSSRVKSIQSRVTHFLADLARCIGSGPFPGQRNKWRRGDWNGGAPAPNHCCFRGLHLLGSVGRKRWHRMRRARKGKYRSAAELNKPTAENVGKKDTVLSTQVEVAEQNTNLRPPPPRAQQPVGTLPTRKPVPNARNLTPTSRNRYSYSTHQAGPSFPRNSLRHLGMDPPNRSSWNPFNLPGPIRMPFTQDEDLMKYWLPPEPEPLDEELDTEAPGQQVRVGHVSVHKVTVEEVKDPHMPRTATSASSGYDSGVSGLDKASLDVGKDKDDQGDEIITFLDQDAWWAATWEEN